ncbi:pantothenate kinase [Halovenus aranensis]|jgi:pantoate kinase|uniref:Pantoate kinase n=1 Tax=Halovenus aranensis TaxID=890420 RepID=A0A1G8YVV2_9EURY|nr:pantoate kinase [Halovenus aranensis]SDK06120.1 pantothenate kinase [Halovenus aranensis]
MTDVAQAFVPGHVTGFFTSDPDPDPTKAGSRGCGIALSDGVVVTVRPADAVSIELNGEPIAMGAVERVLDTLEAPAAVSATTDLPLGSGFGVSGAMAFGTALATNAAFDRRLSRNELVTIAHGAEVQAGTGLGDVVAQAHGGVTIRLEPGGPQDNVLDRIPARRRIEYHVIDELATDDVLDGETTALTMAGKKALSEVVQEPTLDRFMRASRTFARESDLLTARVRDVVLDVSEAGGSATMAMLGETVVALGTGLTDAGYDPGVCQIHPAGATLEPDPSM